MKDAAHHRVHVQKKVIQSIRRGEQAKTEKINGVEQSKTGLILDGVYNKRAGYPLGF